MTLKEIIIKNKDKDEDFFQTYIIGEKKFVVSIDDKELLIEVYCKTGDAYEPGTDLVINDWDDDDWDEFNAFSWPKETI